MLFRSLLVGAGLVIVVLMVFLRSWKASLIVATVIPLSLLFAFILMDARGVSANLISLGAVDFGIIVDSAVVLVEALMVRLALGAVDANAQHATYGWRLHELKNTAVSMGHPILFSKAIIILAFLVWHLLDLTAGTVNGGKFVRGDAYANVYHSFDRPVVAIAYIVANIALGVHLFHGVWSLFQSMGWSHPRFNTWRRHIAAGVATLIVVGNEIGRAHV